VNKNFILVGVVTVIVVLGLGAFLLMSKNTTSVNNSVPTNNEATSTTPGEKKKGFSMADVATHKDESSCWAVVNNKVYDLTSWISKHPGGPERILGICGTDGTAQFEGQHMGQEKPESYLSSFYIGDLSN